jgi:hypothetical protein
MLPPPPDPQAARTRSRCRWATPASAASASWTTAPAAAVRWEGEGCVCWPTAAGFSCCRAAASLHGLRTNGNPPPPPPPPAAPPAPHLPSAPPRSRLHRAHHRALLLLRLPRALPAFQAVRGRRQPSGHVHRAAGGWRPGPHHRRRHHRVPSGRHDRDMVRAARRRPGREVGGAGRPPLSTTLPLANAPRPAPPRPPRPAPRAARRGASVSVPSSSLPPPPPLPPQHCHRSRHPAAIDCHLYGHRRVPRRRADGARRQVPRCAVRRASRAGARARAAVRGEALAGTPRVVHTQGRPAPGAARPRHAPE